MRKLIEIKDEDLIFTRGRSNATLFKKKEEPVENTNAFKIKLKQEVERLMNDKKYT